MSWTVNANCEGCGLSSIQCQHFAIDYAVFQINQQIDADGWRFTPGGGLYCGKCVNRLDLHEFLKPMRPMSPRRSHDDGEE